MKVIDCHVHCFPDDLAERAVARLTSAYQVVPSFDGTIGGAIRQMESAGIERSVVLPVATKPSQVKSINDWIMGIKDERIIPFGAIHPYLSDVKAEISRIARMGIKGVKLHPNWQGYKPQDTEVFPMYEAIMEYGLIAYFHGGDELEPWPTEIVSTPEAYADIRRRFPEMKMVIAHMGGYLMWDDVRRYLLGADVYFDMSACFPDKLSDEEYLRMMREHGIEKILYASDSPCSHPVPQMERLLRLPLTESERRLIFWGNAAHLLGLRQE